MTKLLHSSIKIPTSGDQALHRREAWLQATVEITSAMLAGTSTDELWPLIASRARAASNSDIALVMLPTGDPNWLMIVAAAGEGADTLLGQRLPLDRSITGLTFATGEPQLWNDWAEHPSIYPPARPWVASFGPGMGVPMGDPEGAQLGTFNVGKRRGRPNFDDLDVAMLSSFASQAVLAKQQEEHRTQAEGLRLLEERDRIARDMHDHVLQELFVTGIRLQSMAAAADAEPRARLRQRLLETVATLDDVIGQIRMTIFGLRPSPVPYQQSGDGVRQRVLNVVHDATPSLGYAPSIHFTGPIELVDDGITGDLIAVVREALSNAARHAHATQVSVDVTVNGSGLTVRVCDNGRGIGDTTRRSGLRNLRVRAERHHGTFTIHSPGEGAALTWNVPLPSEGAGYPA
ncbi:GAF domain-containing sensor histidine kinase [Actinopolymorpha sp. NPDC004070]|uniref:GAF domain-containing sensor histidine kinase n=1 Tax=Actinopolymorpha sp. NPDC004070 TaxID=3154548 RepID=UPI0033AB4986